MQLFILLLIFLVKVFAQQGSNERLATEFLLRGEIDKAINIFEEEYSKNPSQNLYNLYLDALLKKNDFKEAEKLVVKQSKKNKNDIPKNVDLLFVYSAAGDIKKQEKIFKELTNTLKSSTYSDYSNAADLLEKRKLNDFAIQILEKGRDNSQNTYTFAEELAVLYEKIGNFEAATGEYVKIILRNREARQNVEASLSRIIATKMSAIPALKKVLLKSIQTHIENMDLNILWIYFLTETSDFTMALTYAKSFDKRFSDNGKQALNLANYIAANDSSFLSEKNFLVAESAYKYVIDKGKTLPNSIDARSGLLELYFNKAAHSVMPDKTMLNNLDIEYQQLITEIGFNEKSVSIIRNWAKMLAVYKNDFERADSLLNAAIKIPRLKNSLLAQCKLDLADLYLLTGEVWEASLLYSQVEKDFKYDELGFEAKFRNARLSYFIGEFGWALAQLEVLRASTSKLIANDAMELSLLISENSDEGEDSNFTALKIFAQADLMMEQKNYAQARRFLDSLSENFPYHSLADEILYQRANIAIAEKNYSAALQYLADIYQNFPNDLLADDAIILSARIYDDILKDKFSTLPLLEKIIIEYPSSIYIDEARERYK